MLVFCFNDKQKKGGKTAMRTFASPGLLAYCLCLAYCLAPIACTGRGIARQLLRRRIAGLVTQRLHDRSCIPSCSSA